MKETKTLTPAELPVVIAQLRGPGLKQGTYRLTQTVDNPKPGRRKSDWTQRGTWEANMVFVLREETVPMPEGYEDRKEPRLTRPGDGLYSLSLRDPRALALLPHLVELEEKPSDWLRRVEGGANMAPRIIDRLVTLGKVSQADIEAVYEDCLTALSKDA
jgi:hypothetical protein